MMTAGIPSSAGIVFGEAPVPTPAADQVLVRVAAAALNRADLRTATIGQAKVAPIGMEWAGEIVSIGADVTDFRPGQRVMCSGVGGYAQFAVADATRVWLMPADLSYEDAAGLPIALMTAHDAVVTNGALASGETLLVNGASSGVGLMALQIGRAKGAGRIVATSTTAAKRDALAAFGATDVVDSSAPAWADTVNTLAPSGADVAIDMVAGASVNQLIACAAVRGRIVNVGRMAGAEGAFDFETHAIKRLHYVGVTFRTRTKAEVAAVAKAARDDLWDDLAAGRLRLPVDAAFKLEAVAEAHRRMASNAHLGKILLTP